MPAPLNTALSLALGAALALATRHSAAQKESFASWQLVVLAAFEALVMTPVATYLLRFHPQWSLLYAFDPQLYPELAGWVGPLSAAAVLLNFAAAAAGYGLARRGIVRRRRWLMALPGLVAGGAAAAVLACCGERVWRLGEFDAFWQGSAPHVLQRPAGWLGVLLLVSAGGLAAWVHRRFGHHDPTLW